MGRIMALDVGDVRIGVAVSDSMKMIASPLETYRRTQAKRDAAYLAELAAKNEVELIVSGLPMSMDGSENGQSEKTRAFIEELKSFTEIPVVFQDERFTSVSAENILIEAEMRREKRKTVIDKIAAAIILQNYLDYKQ